MGTRSIHIFFRYRFRRTAPRKPVAKKKKLSLGTVMILHAIARGRAYGFDIMEDTGLSCGTTYPTLDRLERMGFAESHWEDARVAQAEKRPLRRYYRITPEGARALQGAMERHGALAPVDLSSHLHPREG
jgi:PadR family transcriptional regulator PadR